jgi:hypothetical protein
MAGDTKPCVDVATVPPMGLSNGSRQTILGTGREDQMDMIRHEAIGPYFDTVRDAVLGEQVSVECVVVFLNQRSVDDGYPAA